MLSILVDSTSSVYIRHLAKQVGWNALLYAIKYKHADAAIALLENNAQVNAPTGGPSAEPPPPALHVAVEQQLIPVVRMLLDRGAIVTAVDHVRVFCVKLCKIMTPTCMVYTWSKHRMDGRPCTLPRRLETKSCAPCCWAVVPRSTHARPRARAPCTWPRAPCSLGWSTNCSLHKMCKSTLYARYIYVEGFVKKRCLQVHRLQGAQHRSRCY